MTVLEPGVDGRTARAHRTRRAVVEALLDLIREGDPRPTAPKIAERAGVSLRSIFQHYSDLETLFAAAGRLHLAQVQEVLDPAPDPTASLPDRIEAFVNQRARVLDFVAPVARAAAIQEPFSAQLRSNRDFAVHALRRHIEHIFAPELETRPEPARTETLRALEMASSWSAWDELRTWGGLDQPGTTAVMKRTIGALLSS